MRRIGLTLFITLLLTALAIPGTAYAASTTIYMSPSGSDSASGTSGSPVKSLQGVKRVLINRGGDTATIMVRAGTYYETKMASWNGIPQDHLNFRRDGSNRPVFDGRNLTGTARYWMSTAGGPSLDVRELLVRNYRTGRIRFDTDGNTVRNMFFERIGNRHVSGGPGYAALHLLGSSKNTFNNIVFRNLENSDCPGCVHGVYAANNSDSNTISNSTFDRITGDPVRFRHGTDNNTVTNNEFYRNGRPGTNRAEVSFWRFKSSETCGTNNRVTNNKYDGRYYSGGYGQAMIGSGSEPGVTRCSSAVSGSGNVRV